MLLLLLLCMVVCCRCCLIVVCCWRLCRQYLAVAPDAGAVSYCLVCAICCLPIDVSLLFVAWWCVVSGVSYARVLSFVGETG